MAKSINGYIDSVSAWQSGFRVQDKLGDDFQYNLKATSVEPDSAKFAASLDRADPLKHFRKRFHYPKKQQIKQGVKRDFNDEDKNGECIYFCGHSLGLQLKNIENRVSNVLKDWAEKGVGCHFLGHLPATLCDQPIKEKMAYLMGAEPNEVAFLNGLTVNIHLLLGTFYKPTAERHKILMVGRGFHSDMYAVVSHVTHRDRNPDDSIIFLQPKQGEFVLDSNEILNVIKNEGNNIAVIFMEAVHYYTGQYFDLQEITRVGHEQGCVVGFDLAHAVGNVRLKLHEWNVDFAMCCTYKYLNSGPGCMGAIFCHSRLTDGKEAIMPAMQGWWGLAQQQKFTFEQEFIPAEGADRFRLSNPSPVLCATIQANLEVFSEAGIDRLQQKQELLTGYLEYLLRKHFPQDGGSNGKPNIKIITPSDPRMRGSQISLLSSIPLDTVEDVMKSRGVVMDVRKPSVVRVTPVPLYNTFSEVYKFVHTFKDAWATLCNNDPEK